MVNVLNKQICSEYESLFDEAYECLFVGFQGLTVEEVNSLRTSLNKEDIRMQVLRSSLAEVVLKQKNRDGFQSMLEGPTAVVWGGNSIIQVSKSVHDFAKKAKKLQIKGGFLNGKPIDEKDAEKLTKIPDRPILLGSIVATFMDPLQSLANGMGPILSSIANLIDALERKRAEEGGNQPAQEAPTEEGGEKPQES